MRQKKQKEIPKDANPLNPTNYKDFYKLDDGKPDEKYNLLDKIKRAFSRDKTYLIRMQMRNGMFRSFLIRQAKPSFTFQNGEYVLDAQMKYFDVDRDSWVLDYHQDFTLPIKRNIDADLLKLAVQNKEDYEVENAINPMTLQTFLTAKIAEGVMRGQQIDEFLKMIRIMVIITLVVSVGHLLLFTFKTGMLSSIKIPGIN